MSYPTTLGLFLVEFHSQKAVHAYQDGSGVVHLMGWLPEYGPAPTVEEVLAWQPSPVPQVAAALGAREQLAAQTITRLKAAVAVALLSGGMSEADTYAAGSAFVVQHAAAIQAYILAGGNPVAGQALLDSITASPPQWWGTEIEAIFEAIL